MHSPMSLRQRKPPLTSDVQVKLNVCFVGVCLELETDNEPRPRRRVVFTKSAALFRRRGDDNMFGEGDTRGGCKVPTTIPPKLGLSRGVINVKYDLLTEPVV